MMRSMHFGSIQRQWKLIDRTRREIGYGSRITREINNNSNSNVDESEINKFAKQAAQWWEPNGPAGPLHRLNPLRLTYIRSAIEKNIISSSSSTSSLTEDVNKKPLPLHGYDVIDVGCGAGLVTEPLARLGSNVLGIDMSSASIQAAKQHTQTDRHLTSLHNLSLKYETKPVEEISTQFDAVLALEIIEHVPDPEAFIQQLWRVTRPGGIVVLSTINRTAKSLALAKLAVEYVLRWLPTGTHEWAKFMTPDEVKRIVEKETNMSVLDCSGVVYHPVTGRFELSKDDMSVNYMMTFGRPLEDEEEKIKK